MKIEYKILRPYGDNEYAEELKLLQMLKEGWGIVATYGGSLPKILLKQIIS